MEPYVKLYEDLKDVVETVGLATFEIKSPKENTKVYLVEFVV